MRLVGLFVVLGLVAAADVAVAGEAKAQGTASKAKRSAPPYRLVRVMGETGQALLLDRNRGKHVVVDVGDSLSGFDVVEIGEDEVVMRRSGESREYVLVAGEAPASRLADPYAGVEAPPAPAPAVTAGSKLVDPYAGVVDPYGSEGVREVQAPQGQRASEQPAPPPVQPEKTAEKAPDKTDKTAEKAPDKTDKTAEKAPGKTDKADKTAEKAPDKADATKSAFAVKRGELDAALGDFDRIAREVEMEVVEGAVLLKRVAPSSFFHRMGLRDGDRVLRVDGTAIKGLDDAAVVYARLAKAKRFSVDLLRGAELVQLRYTIAK